MKKYVYTGKNFYFYYWNLGIVIVFWKWVLLVNKGYYWYASLTKRDDLTHSKIVEQNEQDMIIPIKEKK